MGFYRVAAGKHYERLESGDILEYEKGHVVESDQNLQKVFPNKFEKVSSREGPEDSHAEAKAAGTTGKKTGTAPTRGLPTKRTRSPLGPEETGNTRAELEEVEDALEEGDTEDSFKTDDLPDEEEDAEEGTIGVKVGKKYKGIQPPNNRKKVKRILKAKKANEDEETTAEDEEESAEADVPEDVDDGTDEPSVKKVKVKKKGKKVKSKK